MNVIQGSILDVDTGVIAHQVNCKHKAGAGLALGIKLKYPHATAAYMAKPTWALGDVLFCTVGPALYVAHMAGQNGYGSDHRYTDYAALEVALTKASAFARDKDVPLCLPYKLGCGLAGGRWSIVEEMIERVCPKAVIYHYVPSLTRGCP